MPPQPRPSVLDIKPYIPGLSSDDGYKLSSNENPLGCSPKAVEAIGTSLKQLQLYPDGGSNVLRDAIANRYGLDAKRIICGSGSDEILQFLSSAYLSEGDEIIQSEYGFLVYRLVAQQAGATTISVPEKNLTADVDAMLAAVTDKTKIVFLANPNNPTGSYLSFDEVKRLHAGLPERVLLVLDAAYAEYVQKNDYSSGLELAGESTNVIMTRTFSKIHGLAAVRLGWAYGSADIIDALNRVRGPFNVNALAQMAGVAAIQDDDFQRESADFNNGEIARMRPEIEKLGLTAYPSVANFILVEFPDSGSKTADAANAFLAERGLIVRSVNPYGLPNCLRISIGVKEANTAVLNALKIFMSS